MIARCPAVNFAVVGSILCRPSVPLGFAHGPEKLRLTEEIVRLEFAPVRVLRQLISIQP
jgi:hypothetical protein